MTNDQIPMTNSELPLSLHWSLGLGHWSFA
jgi:hypothetical protein